jgi:hypothetical protein
MKFDDIDDMRRNGFVGFVEISALQEQKCGEVPNAAGVHFVLRADSTTVPTYLVTGSGGHFKRKNPNVALDELERYWVDRALVLYIGKAGPKSATLRSRLQQYMRFGSGEAVGHWGGRYIWQLRGSRDLLVCWKVIAPGADPRDEEKQLIREFEKEFQKPPFANLRG